jgi:hypothetical protein
MWRTTAWLILAFKKTTHRGKPVELHHGEAAKAIRKGGGIVMRDA